jgi:hypothetical protein
MKKQIRNQLTALFLLLPVAGVLLALPASAAAEQDRPELRSLDVATDDGLNAGATLDFTVVGTPRAHASLSVRGAPRNIVLKESARGVYTGSYTVRRQDRISESSPIRVELKARKRNVVNNFAFPEGIANTRVAVAPPVALKIDRFTVAPVDRIEPGAELRFTLNGMAGGTADFDIPGVINNVPMREVSPGVYEGAYTIRRLDNLAPSRPVVASLRVGDRVVSSPLTQSLLADAKPPVIRHMSPRDGETVAQGATTSVSGTFDDAGGVGVDTKSVRIILAGRDVTAATQITPQFFTYRGDLSAGRYPVDVRAKDLVGNAVRQTWSFDVAPAVSAAPATVLLQVSSPANNTEVGGGPVVVRGRTAPGAMVDVKVDAVGTLAGLFGMNQDLLTQRIQADGNGNFSFSFSPQFPLPGTRYEILMTAGKDGMLATETRLVLFQKQG